MISKIKSFKEKYWKYSLIVIILVLGLMLFKATRPYLGGVLGAFTVYVLLRKQLYFFVEKKKWRKSLAAILLVLETILVFLIPFSLIIWMAVAKIQDINLDPQTIIAPVEHVIDLIKEKTGYDLFNVDNIRSMASVVPKIGQFLMSEISNFGINVLVLVLVLYFMLIGGRKMEQYFFDILPFNDHNKKDVLHEIHLLVRSNAIGIPLLAVIQGGVATIGFYIFGVPNPILFGFLTSITTIIPILGAVLVWVPLVIYLILSNEWPQAIGLTAYSAIIISQSDNFIRFLLQKKMADTHPLITIFGVIIGLSMFGFMGIIFGPLMISIFLLCVDIFKKEYLDGEKSLELPATKEVEH